MKTYYGQMTREELDKTYFVPSTVQEMNQFIEMCVNAGYAGYKGCVKHDIRKIGVNCYGDNSVGWSSLEGSFYEDKGMTQIKWQPHENKPAQQDLKSTLEKAVAKRNKLKAKLDKLSEKLKKSETELNSIMADIENEYESVDGVKCEVSIYPDERTDKHYTEWQAGDILEYIGANSSDVTLGNQYIIIASYKDIIVINNDLNIKSQAHASRFKFISRPQ